MTKIVYKKLKGEPTRQIDRDQRTVVYVMTCGETDRDGETVDPRGGNFEKFLANPVICWNHETDQPPIGRLLGKPWLEEVGPGTKYPEVGGERQLALLGRVQFDVDPRSDGIYQQVVRGVLKGFSISFDPTGKPGRNDAGGAHYPQWELIEGTICTVGSNPRALATLKKCLNCAAKYKTICECKTNGGRVHRLVLGGNVNKTANSYLVSAWNGHPTDWDISRIEQEVNSTKGQALQDTWEGMGMVGRANRAQVLQYFKQRAGTYWRANQGTERRSQSMKRKAWRKGKSLWLLKSEGRVAKNGMGLDEEMKDYLQMRGLDEVKVADEPPTDPGYAPVEEAEAPPMGDPVQMDVSGAMPPDMPKAEDIADDVAMRAADLSSTGMANEPAVDMAMEERGLPKSARAAVKHLALARLKADDDDKPKSKADDDDDKDKKKSVAPGKLARTKGGNLVLVRSVDGKTAKVAKVSGDEEEVKAKSLKVIKKSAEWGLPAKITAWGDMQAKLTNWYGTFTGTIKSFPALKDADLTGEEQKDVNDAVDEAFMKAADDLDLKGFLAQPPPAQKDLDDAPNTGNLQNVGTTKSSDSIVPQTDLPGSNSPDMSLAIGSNGSADSAGNDLSTVPQGKLPNSNPGKSIAYPKKELKAYAKHVAAKVAKSHSPKLQKTIEKRASRFIVKFVRKAQPSENISGPKACQMLKDGEANGQQLTAAQRGMLGAACARSDKKLAKRFPGGCGKSKKCRKGWLCKKCCKALVRKADGAGMMTNATVESPPPLGTTQGVQVRATPDGQFETWNTSTGAVVDGPFPSADAAGEALSKHLRKNLAGGGGEVFRRDWDGKYGVSVHGQAIEAGPFSSQQEAQSWIQKAATPGGTDTLGTPTTDNIEGSPTGGGTMELKADDDDDKVTKRGRKLLTKADDDDDEDKSLKDLQKQLDAAAKAVDSFGKKVYQQTAVKV